MKYNDSKVQSEISQSFQDQYGLKIISTDFIPVGEESYTYILTTDNGVKYFAKYCEQAGVIKNIDKVNDLLLQLKDYPFVVPPLRATGEKSFNVLNGKMYVYPYIEGEVINMGNDRFDKELVDELTKIMAAIHNASISVELPKEQFQNAFDERLTKLLEAAHADRVEEDIRQLLTNNETVVRDLIAKYDSIAHKYVGSHPRFVLTHGDITGLNLIRSNEGIKLVDWDGAMLAPAERDINFLFDNPNFSIEKYFELTHQNHFEPELKEYYSQDWALNSIIGNFESILNDDKARGDKRDYVDEINEYLSYYR